LEQTWWRAGAATWIRVRAEVRVRVRVRIRVRVRVRAKVRVGDMDIPAPPSRRAPWPRRRARGLRTARGAAVSTPGT